MVISVKNITSFNVTKGVFWQLVVIMTFLMQLLLFYLSGINQFEVDVLKYELCIAYLLILTYSYRKYGAFNLYVLFLFTMFIFIYARVFLDLMDVKDIGEGEYMDPVYFSLDIQFELFSLLIMSLLCIHLGHSYCTPDDAKESFSYEYSPTLEWWSLFFFALSLPGTLYKYMLELKVILANGYLALFDGTLATITYPVWTAGSGTVFISSYAVFLSSRPSKKKFLLVSAVFFLLNFLNMLKGSRSKIFVPLLFLLWLYFTFYKAKPTLRFWKLALFGSLSVIFSQWMVVHRMGSDVIVLSEVLKLFLIQQGFSILILGYMIYYKHIFINQSLPYIFGPLMLWGMGSGQSFETVQQTHLLSHKLTYFLNPSHYLNGAGVGASFLGEFYDLGIVAFILLSLFAGYLIAHVVSYIKRKRIFFVFAFFWVQAIIYMPRNSFFPMLIEVLPCIIFYLLVCKLAKHVGILKVKLYT